MRPHTDTFRTTAAALALTLSALLWVVGSTGCSQKNTNANQTPNQTSTTTTGSSAAQFQIGNMLNYGSFGTSANLDCADGKSLNVGGSNNTLTVTGTCSTVSIGGADNKITFDKIDKHLSVVGLNNTITYKNGDPKVENLGSGNVINKG